MSKYTFICEEESTPYSKIVESKKTVEFRADGLDDILQQFETFLRGSGFHFDGYLDVVKDDYSDEEEMNYIFEHQSDSPTFNFSDIPQNNWPFGDLKPQSDCTSER